MRSCAPIAIDDCKEANGINYCYCKKEGCNTPERKLSDPHKPGLGHSQAAARISTDQSFGRYFDDDEDLSRALASGENSTMTTTTTLASGARMTLTTDLTTETLTTPSTGRELMMTPT